MRYVQQVVGQANDRLCTVPSTVILDDSTHSRLRYSVNDPSERQVRSRKTLLRCLGCVLTRYEREEERTRYEESTHEHVSTCATCSNRGHRQSRSLR